MAYFRKRTKAQQVEGHVGPHGALHKGTRADCKMKECIRRARKVRA